jgi:hypothetical protein
MANQDVIPRTDAEFDSFQLNLLDVCNTNAGTWNIPPAVLGSLAALQSVWAAAWAIAKIKNNRTPAQVAAKNVARKNYVNELRPFIQTHIYRNSLMTNDDIVECGLKPRDTVKTPVPVPTAVPVMELTTGAGNTLVIRFFRLDDETGAIRRGKPKGVARIEMAYQFTTEPASPDDCPHRATATRSPIRVTVSPSIRGQKIWYYVRWVNTREEAGPWSDLAFYIF